MGGDTQVERAEGAALRLDEDRFHELATNFLQEQKPGSESNSFVVYKKS